MPWKIENKGKSVGEVRIYGVISDYKWWEEDVSPTSFQKQIEGLGNVDLLKVYLNTPGGGVNAGNTIYNILKRHEAHVETIVDGTAASMGSLILQAGNERKIAKNGTVYIHSPLSGAYGYAKDLRKYADYLDKVKETLLNVFEDSVKITRKEVSKLMDQETLMISGEALEMGFVDSVEDYNVETEVENNNVTINGFTFDSKMFNYDMSKLVAFKNIDKNNQDEKSVHEMERRFHDSAEMQSRIIDMSIGNIE